MRFYGDENTQCSCRELELAAQVVTTAAAKNPRAIAALASAV